MLKKSVSIIGFGHFGEVLHRLLKDDFQVTIFRRHPITDLPSLNASTKIASSLEEAMDSEIIFFCTPIETFGQVIHDCKKYFRSDQLLIDVLSVKTWPAKVFLKELSGTKTRAMLTHPMFGPDSSRNGFKDLPIVMDQFTATNEEYKFWENLFTNKGLNVIHMTPKEHDKTVAHTQALTHLIGRLLDAMNIRSSRVDTSTFKLLLQVKEVVCRDTIQLFDNMHQFNPHTARMRKKLKREMNQLLNKLEKSSDTITIGDNI